MTAFVGLDGFVDEILHVVDKRESADKYLRLPSMIFPSSNSKASVNPGAPIVWTSDRRANSSKTGCRCG
jgi:hypothetical protein